MEQSQDQEHNDLRTCSRWRTQEFKHAVERKVSEYREEGDKLSKDL